MGTPEPKLWYLQRLDLFAGLSSDVLDGLGQALPARGRRRGELIAGPDAPPNLVCLVHSGTVRIYQVRRDGRPQTLALLRAGHLFGTSPLIGAAQRAAFARMLDDGEICELVAEEFVRILAGRPASAEQVLVLLLRQLVRLEQESTRLLGRDIRGRLASVLLQLAEEHAGELPERLTHDELARLVGTSRETITRTLVQFAERGLVVGGYRRLRIIDLEGLRREVTPESADAGRRGRPRHKPTG